MQNTGQILRSKKTAKSRYTPISNEILQSTILTPEEKSILVHLLSLPEDWVVYKGIIWKQMNMGRDRFNKNWKGLVEKGYIISIKLIDTNTNLISGYNHIVYEEPVLSECRTNQESDLLNFSKPENQSTYKEIKEESNNKQNNNITVFNEFWEMYNKKQNKEDSINAFKKIKSTEYDLIKNHIPIFVKQFKDKQFQPYFSTYLNKKRWQDEVETKQPIQPRLERRATLND
jgi:hypothetical protein